MEIILDTKLLEENEISADDYILMWCLYHNTNVLFPINPNTDELESKKLISEETGEFRLTDVGTELFQDPDWQSNFEEFYNAFPESVISPQNIVRILRTKSLSSKIARDAKAKYKKVHKKHNQIMEGLKNELKTTDTRYLHNIITWLNQQRWERFLNKEIISETSKLHKDV